MIEGNNIFVEGPTSCGKSFLVKSFCRGFLKQGLPVFVAEPNGDNTWPCTWKTEDIETFFKVCNTERGFVSVIDECDSMLKRDLRFNWFANKIRHRDSISIFLAQRLFDVLPGIRDNCRNLIMFNTNPDNAKEWAGSFNNRQILDINSTLKEYHYLHAIRGPCGGKISQHAPAKAR